MSEPQREEQAVIVGPGQALQGEISVPGDKSISHRGLMLGAIAEGTTRIEGLLEATDCLNTLKAMRQLGAGVTQNNDGSYSIAGVGQKGLSEPDAVLDLGNSGTSTRLLLGLLSGYPVTATMTGDASLRQRPMKRVTDPLRQMGAVILGRDRGNRLPLTVAGGGLKGLDYSSPVASAQVKSCLLLAGLRASGLTRVTEPSLSRDHSERMLSAFGAEIHREGLSVSLEAGAWLKAQRVVVPGDLSSAAFFLVAALLAPDSRLVIKNVGLNPTRTGLLDVLRAMGGKIRTIREEQIAGEPIGDLEVETSALKGVEIGSALVPRMIDEFPILTLAALRAQGRTVIRDAKELRFKESDRIDSIVRQFQRLGAKIEPREDGYLVQGPQKIQPGGVDSEGDHRIAMTMAVAGLLAEGETRISHTRCVKTSFPDFFSLLETIHGIPEDR